jgi:dihydroflavonol-4-reductase
MENPTPQHSDNRTAFVTGATGQVGGAVTRALLAQGRSVKILARNPSALKGLDGVEVVKGDLSNLQILIDGMTGCSEVIHIAGAISYDSQDRDWLYETNVVGTQNMLDAAASNNVERFLYTSSIATIGHVPDGTIGDENIEYNWKSANNPYFDTKKEAEDRVLSEQRFSGITVNPGIIFGPGDLGRGAIQMMHKSATGTMTSTPPGATTVVCLKDTVSGHLLALQHGRPGERYILGSETMTLRSLFEQIADVVGVPHPTRTLGPTMFRTAVHLANSWNKLKGTPPSIGPTVAGILIKNRQYSWQKAVSELGYTPTAFASSLAACWEDGGVTSDPR